MDCAGIDSQLTANLANLPGELQASISSANALNAYIAPSHYTFERGQAQIIATGEGNTFCLWQLNRPAFHKTQTASFAVVFKVPHRTKAIHLTALAVAEPGWQWLIASVRGVFAALSRPMQMLLRRPDAECNAQERLPIGDHEQWTIILPH